MQVEAEVEPAEEVPVYHKTPPSDWTKETTEAFYHAHPECYEEYYQQLTYAIMAFNQQQQ